MATTLIPDNRSAHAPRMDAIREIIRMVDLVDEHADTYLTTGMGTVDPTSVGTTRIDDLRDHLAELDAVVSGSVTVARQLLVGDFDVLGTLLGDAVNRAAALATAIREVTGAL